MSCLQYPDLLPVLQHHLRLLLKTLSMRPAYPLALRNTSVVSFFLKQFSSKLETGAEVILTQLIKLITGEAEARGPRHGRTKVLAMEIMRR